MATPVELKPIAPILSQARQLSKINPLVSYFLRFWAVKKAIDISGQHPQVKPFIGQLLTELESTKAGLAPGAISDDQANKSLLTEFGFKAFLNADDNDRAGRRDKSTAKTFMTASLLLEATAQFGEVAQEIQDRIKYAKYRTMVIMTAIRNGVEPDPPPSVSPEEEELNQLGQSDPIDGFPQTPTVDHGGAPPAYGRPPPSGSQFPQVPTSGQPDPANSFPQVPTGGSHQFPQVPGPANSFPQVPTGSHQFPQVPGPANSFPQVPTGSHQFPQVPGPANSFPQVPSNNQPPSVQPNANHFPQVPPAGSGSGYQHQHQQQHNLPTPGSNPHQPPGYVPTQHGQQPGPGQFGGVPTGPFSGPQGGSGDNLLSFPTVPSQNPSPTSYAKSPEHHLRTNLHIAQPMSGSGEDEDDPWAEVDMDFGEPLVTVPNFQVGRQAPNYMPNTAHIVEAQKYAKFAYSALNFDDITSAVTNLLKSLNQLTGLQYRIDENQK